MPIPQYLHAVHDADGAQLMDGFPGWVVITEAIGHDAGDHSGRDYSDLTRRGFGVVVRLNNAHNGVDGTIPEPAYYGDFAQRCANFVAASVGIDVVIIGNEPNHQVEWPHGNKIHASDYAVCYEGCLFAIREVNPTVQVLVAAVAPWYNEEWLTYLRTVVNAVHPIEDGYALHAYTHGADPALVFSDHRDEHGWLWHLRTYRDQISVIASVPPRANPPFLIITEADQNEPWADVDSGWVQNACQEIDDWNRGPHMPIRGLAIYRSNRDDKWSFADKEGVKKDFRKAVERAYPAPPMASAPPANKPPKPSEPMPPQTALLPRQIDPRLIARGVTIETPPIAPGQSFWYIVKAQWYNEQESQGRHHIYIEAQDPDGRPQADVPFLAKGQGSQTPGSTNGKTGFDAANVPMWASEGKNGYSVWINGSVPSETLKGVGMGADTPEGFNAGIHTSTGVVFQWATMPNSTQPPQPTPGAIQSGMVTAPAGLNVRSGPSADATKLGALAYGSTVLYDSASDGWLHVVEGWLWGDYVGPVQVSAEVPTAPLPPAPLPEPTGDTWQRSRAFVKKWEGGFQDADWDLGNWTGCEVGKGEKKGTNFGISACSYPDLDIRNLTIEQADAIYFRDYWQASGADKLPWPFCLLVFDTAVNFHPTTAKKWLEQSGNNALTFVALRLRGYRHSASWAQAGDAWVDRVIDVAMEAAK